MILLFIYLTSIIILTSLITFMIMAISKKSMTDSQKLSPFECGFNPMSNKRMPFSIHFFMIAIIFLIFDVEIIILLPCIFTMKFSIIKYWSTTFMLFVMILIIGLYYEWHNGMLNWSK